jgi:hypothetical protein
VYREKLITGKVVHKFKAKPVKKFGIYFKSQLEYHFYQHLELQKKAGIVLFYLRNIRFDLPGGVKCEIDYLVFYTNGTARIIDVKGHETREFKLKKKMVEELYPVEIELVKKGDF